MSIHILAIESSCDDTSAAILIDGKIKSNIIANQSVHAEYGGVVPELASRKHQINIIPVVQKAINDAEIQLEDINAIAFTRGPGLLGSLMVGLGFAKSFALARDIPMIDVHHMQAHVLAHFAEKPYPRFPFLCLTVSGGHTQIVLVHSFLSMEVVGSTIDDAAGEAFDKTGKILGLPYPAGPIIDKLAKEGEIKYPFPKSKVGDLDFSFSGLKTSILYFLKKKLAENPLFIEEEKSNICASVQHAIIDNLMVKLIKASEKFNITEIAIAGGVSANSGLRQRLKDEALIRNWNHYIPEFQYCTDNAGMIAMAAYYKYLENEFCSQDVKAMPRWPISR